MSRFTEIITLDKFKDICRQKLGVGTDEFDPYEFPETIVKDLAKVNFDFENWNIGDASPKYEKYPSDHKGFAGYPCGFKVLDNGMPALFVNAGGDWEHPICFCIYWDGKKLRAYIPSDGNVYNKKEKCAFGSEEDMEDYEDSEFFLNKPSVDPEKIFQDVMGRIKVK
jgi:hypothetical protein